MVVLSRKSGALTKIPEPLLCKPGSFFPGPVKNDVILQTQKESFDETSVGIEPPNMDVLIIFVIVLLIVGAILAD